MSNFFEDLNKKGIESIELSIREIQKLFLDGEITQDQFTKILIDSLGYAKFMQLMGEMYEQSYSKDLLTKPLPEGLDVVINWGPK